MDEGSRRELAECIGRLAGVPAGEALPAEAEQVVDALLTALERGELRAAERDGNGVWHAVPWVKLGILLAFRAGRLVDMSPAGSPFRFFDKHTVPTQAVDLQRGVRVVPGGSSIRRGAYLARGVVCMPPSYVNVGAFVGEGTMVDSHATVGSSAQIGARVHVSAASQIGGVLEPVGAVPVVIEDDVFVGGNCGVYEGTVVRERAVLASGVILTRAVPVFDLVNETVYRADGDRPLEIPAAAVVVPGSRAIRSGWGAEQGLALQTPVIVKYRDSGTDASVPLEDWLR
ncbi:MAG TPA: 2,3,4,5-tetrahydropyridine-2,6-dicarboxylate N-succinyltransferase [Gemmatimonadaceae bacterium]|jgi:2,3,4,5-tetrahydropyridine-2-carboxylate N-succinyltransferase|nr:2,3,4,5-tetrahydropyridine-2,6-dicarboxylate N-succinyltransferase [Gemmatimonadaceae bacterium]